MSVKKPVAKAPEPVVTQERVSRSWDFGNVFWGLMLLSIGTMFLLQAFKVVELDYSTLWSLWPLLIIALGVSILPIRKPLAFVSAGLLTLAMVALVVFSLLGMVGSQPDTRASVQNISIAKNDPGVKDINVMLKAGASNININSKNSVSVVDAKLTSNNLQLKKTSTKRDLTQDVELKTEGTNRWWVGEYKNELDLNLTEALPVSLDIDAGAVDLKGDLTNVTMQNLTIKSGVSNLDIKLGSKSAKTNVNIDVGVSSIKITVPSTVGLSLKLESGVSNTELPGLREVSKDYYESANYNSAERVISINGKIGLSNLAIEYY